MANSNSTILDPMPQRDSVRSRAEEEALSRRQPTPLEILQADNFELRERLRAASIRPAHAPDDFAAALRHSLDALQGQLADMSNPISRFAVRELTLDTQVQVDVSPLGTIEYRFPAPGERLGTIPLSRLSLTVSPIPHPEAAATWEPADFQPEVELRDLPFFGAEERRLLRENGVFTLGELLVAGSRVRSRARLVGLLEIDRQRLAAWLDRARLLLIRDLSSSAARVLATAGLGRLESLASLHPRTLVERFNRYLKRLHEPGLEPLDERQAAAWSRSARLYLGWQEEEEPAPPEAGSEPLTELPGISAEEIGALEAIGVSHAGELRWRARNAAGLALVARRSGLPQERLESWLESPYLFRLEPPGGEAGEQVRVEGRHLGEEPGEGLTFGGEPAQILEWRDRVILAEVPPGAGPGPVVGRLDGTATNPLIWRGPRVELDARSLTVRPVRPGAGETVTSTVTIGNSGSFDSGAFDVEWELDGELCRQSVASLEPGAEVTLSLERELGSGRHHLRATIDPDCRMFLDEQRTTTLRREILVAAKSPENGTTAGSGRLDLGFRWIGAEGWIEAGGAARCEISIRHTGDPPVASLPLAVDFDPEVLVLGDASPAASEIDRSGGAVRWRQLAPLAPGGEQRVRLEFRARPDGEARTTDVRAAVEGALDAAGGVLPAALAAAGLGILPRLIDLPGIGAARFEELAAVGIRRAADLAAATPRAVAAALRTSEEQARELIAAARRALHMPIGPES